MNALALRSHLQLPLPDAERGVVDVAAPLRAIAALLADATEAKPALESVIALICRNHRWDCGRYLRRDETTGKLKLEAQWTDTGAATAAFAGGNEAIQRRLEARAVERAAQSGATLGIADLSLEAPDWNRCSADPRASDSAHYFPATVEGRVVGVLALLRSGAESADREPDDALIPIVAHIGQFVERKCAEAALLESVKRHQALARESAQWHFEQQESLRLTDLLSKFGQDALSISAMPPLLDAAVSTLIAGLGVDSAAVLRLDEVGHDMLIEAGAIGDADPTAGLAAYSGLAAPDAFLRARAVPLAIGWGEPESSDALSEFLKSRGVGRALEVIIGSPQSPFGVLGAYSSATHGFRPAGAGFMRSVAGMLGAAVARVQAGENFAYLAQYDALTSLANRTLFRDQLAQRLSVAAGDGTKVAVLYLDLDGFKNVNDSHGHDSGDRLLALVAERLRVNVPEKASIGRQGGDEFAVEVGGLADDEHALLIAEHLSEELGRPFNLDDREICISASIGVAVYPDDGTTADTLIKNADTAMYQGKQQGRNNFRRYSVRLDGVAVKRRRLVVELHQASMEQEFELHYQPQVSLASGRIIGAEAFLRWWHPVHGILSAGDFIGVAEESGLISQIGAWVLETACRQVVEWQRGGAADFYVSVNVSPLEVRRGKLPELVRRALAASGLAARHLELELTESGVSGEEHEMFSRTLRELDALGVSIAIDDFGSTHSGLRLLKNPAIDKIKIDPSFTRNAASDPDDGTIAQGVITMAHHVQIDTVAKGVETEEQARFLRRSRCDIAQGFLFGAPMQASSFNDLLTSNAGSSNASGATRASAAPVPQFFPLGSLDHAEDDEASRELGFL